MKKRDWWDRIAAGPIAGKAGGFARCLLLAKTLGLELLAVAAAMETGDYYRGSEPLAAETVSHAGPAYWD